MKELPTKVWEVIKAALRRARQWRRPPHWDPSAWQEELEAIAQAAACEACWCLGLDDEHCSDTPSEAFIFGQVLTALRDFHRREWVYFTVCCVHLQNVSNEAEEGGGSDEDVGEQAATERFDDWRFPLIRWALRRLSDRERQVIKGLYWEGFTEAEIAWELGISQQAVSKIKRKALRKLRKLLKGLL